MREAARRFHFQLLIAARAEAGVDGHHNRKRQLRFAMKHRDLLRVAVFEYLEIILLERRDRRAAGVGHGREDVHQLYIHLEGCVGLIVGVCGLRLAASGGWATPAGGVWSARPEDAAPCSGLTGLAKQGKTRSHTNPDARPGKRAYLDTYSSGDLKARKHSLGNPSPATLTRHNRRKGFPRKRLAVRHTAPS